MINKQIVAQALDQLEGLMMLVETYETIAGTSVRRIRHSTLTNREFHVGLNQMYQEIMHAYKKEIEQLMKEKKITSEHMMLNQHTKKTVLMLLSANTGLYGDVLHRTFTAFITELKRTEGDIAIIGRMGKIFFEEMMPGKEFTYFDFPDNTVSLEHLKRVSAFLGAYEKVVVFYAVFKNLLIQQVQASIISGTELPAEEIQNKTLQPYFFEPSLEKVTLFFEKEIFASLLEQVFQESRLAKLASRMVLLDRAVSNIELALKHVSVQKQQVYHRVTNRQLLNSLSGMALWK